MKTSIKEWNLAKNALPTSVSQRYMNMTKINDIKKGDLLTIEQAQSEFGFKAATIRHWRRKSMDANVEAGRYPEFRKVGGTIYLVRASLLAVLNGQDARSAN